VCAYPFPSTFYEVADDASPTGVRLALTPEILPRNVSDPDAYLAEANLADGFPTTTAFVTVFPDGALDPSVLPTPLDLAPSLTPESPVQIIDLDAGERVPTWGEPDLNGASPAEQPLLIRPMRAIPFGHRVAVVVTDALRYADGSTPEAPVAFAALRDGEITDSPVIEGRRDAFEALFARLEEHGLERGRLLLAWEAVINSRENAQGPLPGMVTAAAEAVDTEGFSYTVTRCVSDDPADQAALGCTADDEGVPLNELTWRRIYGTVELPTFLDPDGRVVRDAMGTPMPQGTASAEFVVNVPDSVKAAAAGTVPLVSFGHGLLAEPRRYIADDTGADGQMRLAERMGAIFIGTRWLGLSNTELGTAAGVVTDFNTGFAYSDLLAQGITNQTLMIPFAREALASDELLAATDGSGSLLDPARAYYTGISLGGIYGTVLMALSPHVTTGVLHVPSSGFTGIMAHSPEFAPFQMVLDLAVRNRNQQQILLVLSQPIFDVGDPINYIEQLAAQTAAGERSCLWQCAVGDLLAPWYGCDMLMRTGGFPQAGPTVGDIFGLDTIDTPTDPGTSAIQIFDPQLGVPTLANDDLVDNGAHKALRRNVEVHDQIIDYFDADTPGRIVNHCDGPCVIDPVPLPDE